MHENLTKHSIDIASIGAVFGTLFGYLPVIAAFLSIIWSMIRIYETKTVQRLLGKTHRRKEDQE